MTIREIYHNAIREYVKKPDDAQLEAWEEHFSRFPPDFLSLAVREWQGIMDEDELTHRPRGAFFPQIAELLRLIKRIESRAKQQNRFTSCGKCSSGWSHCRIPGIRPGTTESAVRRCQCWKDWMIANGRELKGA